MNEGTRNEGTREHRNGGGNEGGEVNKKRKKSLNVLSNLTAKSASRVGEKTTLHASLYEKRQ